MDSGPTTPDGSPESQRIATPSRALTFGTRILRSGYTQAARRARRHEAILHLVEQNFTDTRVAMNAVRQKRQTIG